MPFDKLRLQPDADAFELVHDIIAHAGEDVGECLIKCVECCNTRELVLALMIPLQEHYANVDMLRQILPATSLGMFVVVLGLL
jgi:hypothetical protein